MTPHGLNDRTRTYDLYHPKVAFYQTELHPDMVGQEGIAPTRAKSSGFTDPRAYFNTLLTHIFIIKTPYIDMFESLDY